MQGLGLHIFTGILASVAEKTENCADYLGANNSHLSKLHTWLLLHVWQVEISEHVFLCLKELPSGKLGTEIRAGKVTNQDLQFTDFKKNRYIWRLWELKVP